MTAPPESTKRRRWPWVLLLVAAISAALVWKLKSDAIADRERLRVWLDEAHTFGIQEAKVSLGLPYLGRALDFLVRDSVAIGVRNDDVAATLMEIKSPQPAGLILVDEGISPEVATQLQRRYPRASMPKLKGAPAVPPPRPGAPAPSP